MDCKVGFIERKVLHDEVFFDNFFILPDLFHDSLILDHPFFQDVTSIRSLAAEFEILVCEKDGHSFFSNPAQ